MTSHAPTAVITGLGLVSSVAGSRGELSRAIRESVSGLAPIAAFDPSPFRTPFGGEIARFDPSECLSESEQETFRDPNIQYAITAAVRALHDAGLSTRQAAGDPRFALIVGTCNGGLRIAEEHYRIILGSSDKVFDREMERLIRYHAVGRGVASHLSMAGPTWVVATACSSSTGALAIALDLIEIGIADRVLVGGSDTLCLSTMAGFDAIRATSTEKTAPFSTPIGLNLGEGAAFFVVESEPTAEARGAEPLGAVLGYTLSGDAHHPTAPDPRGDGAYRTMAGAIERAGLSVDDIGAFNAHGTGTEANDRVESKAIARLIEDRDIPVYSFKSQVGHCMGAAGIIEAAAGLVAMQNDLVPATVNFKGPRPGCTLSYVPNVPISKSYDAFVSCNYAFGGNNAGVVISKPHRAAPRAIPNHRAVLTGSGIVSALGLGSDVNLTELIRGTRGRTPLTERVKTPALFATVAGLVPSFTGREVDRRIDFRPMNPLCRFATAAARFALSSAGIRIGPREGLRTGIVNGVHVGPNEEDYMRAVIATGGREADIGIFSQVVANATAGWVSNALQLKGYSTTIAQGPDAGLFALLLSALAVRSGGAHRIVAGAADELYPRYLVNYHELEYLHTGPAEANFGLNFEVPDRRLMGEGAAYVVVENRADAASRGTDICAEVSGFGMTTDPGGFFAPCNDPQGLASAAEAALTSAGWRPEDVGLVVWSPKGNSGDLKIIAAAEMVLGAMAARLPFVTSVFHTGLMEATSGTATLAAIIEAWRTGASLWPQRTGLPEFDARPLPEGPVNALVLASSELGFNLALAISPERTPS